MRGWIVVWNARIGLHPFGPLGSFVESSSPIGVVPIHVSFIRASFYVVVVDVYDSFVFVSPVIESAFRPAGDIVDYGFDACKRSRKSAHIGEGVFFVEVQLRGRRKLRQRPWRRALV